MEGDDRRRAYNEAEEYRDEYEGDVHYRAVRGYSCLSCDAHKLCVIKDGDDRGGNVAEQLRGAVKAGLKEQTP